MRKNALVAPLLPLPLFLPVFLAAGISRAAENTLFAYTHQLQSPFTLQAGRLVLGSDMALGITDFLQVGTNVLYDFYQVYNANAKVSLVDRREFAAGVTLGYTTYNYKDIAVGNPDLRVSSYLPGVITAFSPIENVALFVGGNLNYTSTNLLTSGIATSGYTTGARVGSDISYAYNPKNKKGVGNVVSAGVSYDMTYELVGFGLSHHWPGFHFGIHYYPNASQYRVQPILAGGAVVEL